MPDEPPVLKLRFHDSHSPIWDANGTATCRLCGCTVETGWGTVTDAGASLCGAAVP